MQADLLQVADSSNSEKNESTNDWDEALPWILDIGGIIALAARLASERESDYDEWLAKTRPGEHRWCSY